MAKGENIFKRKDGRWEARYVKGYQSDGKIRYGFCYGKTYRDAKEKVTKAKAAMLQGNSPIPVVSKQRFAIYCAGWMEANKSRLKPATRVKYECIMEKYIKPRLGRCFPQGFNDQIIGEFTNELLFMEELAPKTVRDILTLLKSVLKYTAKQLGGVFPQIDIVLPKDTRKEMRVLSREEQAVFTAYLLNNMDEQKFGVLLALLTGVRIGELCALRWENISLKDGTIRITSTMQRLKDIDANGEAKTKIVDVYKRQAQTFVDALKAEGAFTKEKQLEAFQKARDKVLELSLIHIWNHAGRRRKRRSRHKQSSYSAASLQRGVWLREMRDAVLR